MILLAAIDNSNGLLFNHRRVSKDRALRERILTLTAGGRLFMDAYSAKQFGNRTVCLPENGRKSSGEDGFSDSPALAEEALPDPAIIADAFLEEAGPGDYVFVEDKSVTPYGDKIEAVYLYKWNRDYPSDFKLDFIPSEHGFQLLKTEDFAGTSHEKITEEIWVRART